MSEQKSTGVRDKTVDVAAFWTRANWCAIFCLGQVGHPQGAILITSAKPLPLDGECASSDNAFSLSKSCMEYPTAALFKTLSAEENAAA
jgi:hypothetical protein